MPLDFNDVHAHMSDVDIIVNFECKTWHQVNFDLVTLTTSLVKTVLKDLIAKPDQGEVSIILSNDSHLQHLNKTYRHQDKATNVLSFDYGQDAFDKGLLGDIFLSYERLTEEAATQQKSFQHHYSHLIVHGLLHLFGYDHEQAQDAKDMEQREIEFLKKFDVPNPYLI